MLVAAAMTLTATTSAAADRGFYAGLGLGVTSYDVADFSPDYAHLRFEDEGFGLRAFAGYRIIKHLGVEVGFTDWGDITLRETNIQREDERVDVGLTSFDLSVLGIVPLGRKTDLYARIGYAPWDADVKETIDDVTVDASRDGSDLVFGAGIDFLIKKIGIRVAMDWLDAENTDRAFMISGNLTYSF